MCEESGPSGDEGLVAARGTVSNLRVQLRINYSSCKDGCEHYHARQSTRVKTFNDAPGDKLRFVSLDLSKAFDRVNWNALWLALHDHGISDHLVWILQLIYANQLGEVQGEHSNSDPFPIHAGVRQGCVLSPRLFCSVLQWGMSAW